VPQDSIQKTRNYYDRSGALDSLIGPGARSGSGHVARKQSWLRDVGGLPVYSFSGNGSLTGVVYDWQGRPSTRYISHVGAMAADGERFADPATESAYDSLQLSVGPQLSAGQRLEYYYNNRGQVELSATHDEFLGDMAIVHRYGYSPSGQLTGDTLEFSDGAKVERYYKYNRLGQRVEVRDTVAMSSGQSIAGDRGGYTRYYYESATGRLSSIVELVRLQSTLADTMARVTFQYDTAGRETQRNVYLDGHSMVITRTTTYDAAGRASSVLHKSGSTVRYSFGSPTWSSIGELLTGTETRGALTGISRFYYDSISGTRRLLKSVDGPSSHTYEWTYDGFGNRIEEHHTPPAGGGCSPHYISKYGPDNRLLVANQSASGCTPYRRYLTDQAGNRLATFRDSLSGYLGLESAQTYTASGQLYFALTPQTPAGPWNFVWNWYDAEGRRAIAHVADGSTVIKAGPDSAWGHRTYYVYDGADVAFTLMKPAGSNGWRIQQRYLVTGLDETVAARLWLDGSQQNLGIISDRQGGFLMAVRPDGLQETRTGFYLRNPFGATEGGDAADASDKHTGLGFTGAGSPTASGGYTYLRNRWYDPATGRFLTQDPIGLAGGTNLYAYAGNDPVGFSDPFGLCTDGPPETIEVRVKVFCGGDVTDVSNYEYQTVVARLVTDKNTLGTIEKGASLLKGGSTHFTPEKVAAEIQATVAAGAVYTYDGATADGGQVLSLASTVGQSLAFRVDVASHLAKGTNFLHRKIGGKYQTACQVLGHEGVHLVQHRAGHNDPDDNERVAEPIPWRCR
jgi:RHS repeat-associated protein